MLCIPQDRQWEITGFTSQTQRNVTFSQSIFYTVWYTHLGNISTFESKINIARVTEYFITGLSRDGPFMSTLMRGGTEFFPYLSTKLIELLMSHDKKSDLQM